MNVQDDFRDEDVWDVEYLNTAAIFSIVAQLPVGSVMRNQRRVHTA
ncbi:MAG: hypothetical protein Q4P24_16585 [Rhodobacterales bacterium]|nr:hypothetical protein [Rhodobacterales bacterium]